MHMNHYGRLAIMAALSFLSMYVLMYSMVNAYGNVYLSLNQFYMAGLMTAPMVVFEILLMGMMYKDRRANAVIIAVSLVLLGAFFIFIRRQIAVSDREFLRSMIPHHAGAILMCEEAPIQDPQLQDLCRRIIAGQRSEIDEMRARLERIEE